MKPFLLLICLMHAAVASAEVRVIPSITLPKRLEWSMNLDECKKVLSEQGITIGDPVHLVQPEWYGAAGWSVVSGRWTSALFEGALLNVRFYFDPAGALQCVDVAVERDAPRWGDVDREGRIANLSEYARAVHDELGRRYRPCQGSTSLDDGKSVPGLTNHRCHWQDELGFTVAFTYDASRWPRHIVTVEYSSTAYREARDERHEF